MEMMGWFYQGGQSQDRLVTSQSVIKIVLSERYHLDSPPYPPEPRPNVSGKRGIRETAPFPTGHLWFMAIRVRVRIIRLSPRVVALDFLRCVQEMSDRQGSASRLRSDAFHAHHPQYGGTFHVLSFSGRSL